MKIRNIIIFILLLLGVYFLYNLKEGLTVQDAQTALDNANAELNAVKNKNNTNLLNNVDSKFRALNWQVKNNGGYDNIMDTVDNYKNSIIELESNKSEVLIPALTQKVEIAKQNLEYAKQQVALEARNIEINKKNDEEKDASNKSIIKAVNNQINVDKSNYDKFLQENYSYFENLTKNAKQIVGDQINNIAKLKKQAIDNNFFINEEPKVKTARITTDKYADPECENDEFIYCSGDKITCEDIFGNPVDSMIEKDNGNGKTYSGCGSGLKAKSYEQFLDDMTIGLTVQGTQSVFYDISSCPSDIPWRVDMYAGDLSFNIGNDLSGVYIKNDYQCYKNPTIASAISKFDTKDTKNLYIDSDVYIDGDYLYDTYKDERNFKLIRGQSKVWVNNKACYKGVIKDITKNNTYNVYVPDYEGQVFNNISSKYLYTINLEYSSLLNKTLTDLKVGSLPRPVCKNGNFTNKCSKKQPETIYFENPDKISYSADAYPLLGEGSEQSCSNKLTFSPYL